MDFSQLKKSLEAINLSVCSIFAKKYAELEVS